MTHSPDHAERAAIVAAGLTRAARLNLLGLNKYGAWAMVCEMQPEATGMGMTLLCTRQPALAERRWTSWGTDRVQGRLRGEGYEYRLTDIGKQVRAALNDEGKGVGDG